MIVTRNGSAIVSTKHGTVTATADAVMIPRTRRRTLGIYEKSGRLSVKLTVKKADVASVSVAGRDKQYMTGKRAAGFIATGGVALLAPSRVSGSLVISTTAGDVFEYALAKRDARHPEAVAAAFAGRGYRIL